MHRPSIYLRSDVVQVEHNRRKVHYGYHCRQKHGRLVPSAIADGVDQLTHDDHVDQQEGTGDGDQLWKPARVWRERDVGTSQQKVRSLHLMSRWRTGPTNPIELTTEIARNSNMVICSRPV